MSWRPRLAILHTKLTFRYLLLKMEAGEFTKKLFERRRWRKQRINKRESNFMVDSVFTGKFQTSIKVNSTCCLKLSTSPRTLFVCISLTGALPIKPRTAFFRVGDSIFQKRCNAYKQLFPCKLPYTATDAMTVKAFVFNSSRFKKCSASNVIVLRGLSQGDTGHCRGPCSQYPETYAGNDGGIRM